MRAKGQQIGNMPARRQFRILSHWAFWIKPQWDSIRNEASSDPSKPVSDISPWGFNRGNTVLIGTFCFHFYRLEKEETKGKLIQSEICQFWGIYAREIQLVTVEMCFPPNSARGIRKFSPFAWESNLNSFRGLEFHQFDAGEIPKNIPFPWQ